MDEEEGEQNEESGGWGEMDEEDEQEIRQLDMVDILDFRWKTNECKIGYYHVKFDNEIKTRKMGVRAFLCDYPDIGLLFIHDKYLHDERTIKYITNAAKGNYKAKGVDNRRVVEDFTTLTKYSIDKKFSKSWVMTQRLKQSPPYDKDVFNLKAPPYVNDLLVTGRSGEGSSIKGNELTTIVITRQSTTQQKSEERIIMESLSPKELCKEVNENSIGMITPRKTVKSGKGRVELVHTPEKECKQPINHVWETFEKGSYVDIGVLNGKCCVGRRDGWLCGRAL